MAHAQLVDAITDSFPSPNLPNQLGKLSNRSIRDIHCLLTAKAPSIKIPCSGGQNGHIGIVLTTTQYALVSQDPFIRPTNPGCTPHIQEWTTSLDNKALLREHAKQHQKYNKCCNIDAILQNQLLTAFENTYLYPLKNAFTG